MPADVIPMGCTTLQHSSVVVADLLPDQPDELNLALDGPDGATEPLGHLGVGGPLQARLGDLAEGRVEEGVEEVRDLLAEDDGEFGRRLLADGPR